MGKWEGNGWGDSPALRTALHARVIRARVTCVHEARVALRRQALIHHPAQAMRGGSASPRTNMTSQPRKRTADDTVRIPIRIRTRQVPEVIRVGEHIRVMEVARIERLVPPRDGLVEAALVPQRHVERPQEVAVPDQELGVAVHVGHPHLVQADEVLISARCWREVSRRWLGHQALDGGDEGELLRGRVGAPFDSHVGVCAAGCFGGRHGCCCGAREAERGVGGVEAFQVCAGLSIGQGKCMGRRESRRRQVGCRATLKYRSRC